LPDVAVLRYSIPWSRKMRIITGRDYYDRVSALGRDDTVVFVRQKDHLLNKDVAAAAGIQTPVLPRWKLYGHNRLLHAERLPSRIDRIRLSRPDRTYSFSAISVWFCGKSYRGVKVYGETLHETGKPLFFWNEDDLTSWGVENGLTILAPAVKWGKYRTWYEDPSGPEPGDYFKSADASPEVMDFLVREGISVMTWERGTYDDDHTPWRVNGDNLKELEFYRVIDVHNAHQEISMWVGGVLPRPGAARIEISDDRIKAAKHGFDRWSFRRKPSHP
jgi:hypothetical protein